MSELIDNRARRIATLKEIIQHLHKGNAPEGVKGQLREIVRQTDASEIMAMEQELISGGMPVEEVRSMCDLHSQVTRDVLVQLPAQPLAPGHPIDTLKRENAALQKVIGNMRGIAQQLADLDFCRM
jgi:hypothetical protein